MRQGKHILTTSISKNNAYDTGIMKHFLKYLDYQIKSFYLIPSYWYIQRIKHNKHSR